MLPVDEVVADGRWILTDSTFVMLSLQSFDDRLRLTGISCEPQGTGAGALVVAALRAHCTTTGLILEISEPFPEAMGFWNRFAWEDVRGGGNAELLLRYTP